MPPIFNKGNLLIRGARWVLVAALVLLPLFPARGQEGGSDTLRALRNETRKEDDAADHFCLVQWYPAEVIRSTTTLVNPAGDAFAPVEEDALVPAARNFLPVSEPLLANLFSPMGKHFEYVIFPGKDKSGARVADPLTTGTLTLKVNSHSFSWHLPLGSLLPPGSCPTCGNVFPGNYESCPYDGTRLKR